MKTKICTSIEQSKKLLELGLKPETADMYYDLEEDYIPRCKYGGYSLFYHYLSAWSLSRLMELIPKTINMDKNIAHPYVDLFNNSIDYLVGMTLYKTIKGESLIDAAVEMIEWLITNKHMEV